MNNLPEILKSNWKLLTITLVAGFLMSTLPKLGFVIEGFDPYKSASIISPLPAGEDPMHLILPLLEKKLNEFKLHKETSLIEAAFADGKYQDAAGYIVVDFDSGKIITEKNAGESLPMASLTKVMTAVVALDLASPDELLTISPKAAEIEPTIIGVVPGQKLTLKEAIEALLLTSANDAAEVIAEGINAKYEGEEIFIRSMNAKAEFLGLNKTHFENPQGFDGRTHFSSAEDLAVLTHYALANYPLIAETVQKDYKMLPKDPNHKQFDLYNWNGLLGVYPGVKGVKIGNTGRAKKTTIVVSERDDKRVMAVLLGAPGILERDLWTSQLLDLGFERNYGLSPVNVTEEQLKEKYATWKYWN